MRIAAALLVWIALWTPPAPADERVVHEDADYRFRIERPGPGWALFDEAEARGVVPDAIAGMTDLKGTFYVVIVEEAPEAKLDAFVSLMREMLPLEDATFGEPETLTYQGLPARRWSSEGKTQGVPAKYRHLVFTRERFVYQLVGFRVDTRAAKSADLDLLAKHLVLTPGEIRGRKQIQATHDVAGVGWRMKEGAYRDAVHRVEVKPPAGWRLAVGDELERMNDSACVGLVASDPEAFVILIVERVRGIDPKVLAAHVVGSVEAEATPAGPPAKQAVGGREFTMRPYRGQEHVPFSLRHGVRVDGEWAVQVQWWCAEDVLKRAEPMVARALAGIRFLSDAEAASLAVEFAKDGDPEESVGTGYGLRKGVYRDFENGFVWTKPSGSWSVATGQSVRAEDPEATILLEEPALGLNGNVSVTASTVEDPLAFHRSSLDALEGGPRVSPPRPVPLGGAEALVSAVRKDEAGFPFQFVVATVLRKGRAYSMVLYGFEGNVAASADAVDAAVRGLSFPERLVPDELGEGTYVDHRLGFRFRAPAGPGWRFTRATPRELAAVSSLVLFAHRRGAVLAGAFCTVVAGQDERFVRNLVVRMLRQQVGDPDAEPTEEAATVAGLPARHLTLAAAKPMQAWITNRGRTFYFLFAGAEADAGFDPATAPTLLELLD